MQADERLVRWDPDSVRIRQIPLRFAAGKEHLKSSQSAEQTQKCHGQWKRHVRLWTWTLSLALAAKEGLAAFGRIDKDVR